MREAAWTEGRRAKAERSPAVEDRPSEHVVRVVAWSVTRDTTHSVTAVGAEGCGARSDLRSPGAVHDLRTHVHLGAVARGESLDGGSLEDVEKHVEKHTYTLIIKT